MRSLISAPLPRPSGSTVQEMLTLKRTQLGLLTGQKCPPALVGNIAARLQLLAMRPKTAAARAEVAAALACQWWGARVVAIKVVACWGGLEDLAWLKRCAEQPQPPRASPGFDWHKLETGVAAGALWACHRIANENATWPQPGAPPPASGSDAFGRWMHIFDLDPSPALLAALSDSEGEVLLMHMLHEVRGSAKERFALVVANRTTLPGRMAVLARLSKGNDEAAQLARAALARNGARAAAPMTDDVFRSIVDALYFDGISWQPQVLAHLVGVPVSTVRLWYKGEAPVPDHIAAWLHGRFKVPRPGTTG